MLLLNLSACQNDTGPVQSQFITFSSAGFVPGKEYVFLPFDDADQSLNSDSGYNIFVDVRYDNSCKIRMLPLHIELSSPSVDSILEKTIEVALFDDNNIALGRGHYGIFEQFHPLFLNIEPKEDYVISLMSREKENQGILAFGIVNRKTNHQ